MRMKILTERLLIRNLRFEDYPEFERILNDIQKSAFGGAINFLNKGGTLTEKIEAALIFQHGIDFFTAYDIIYT